MAEVSPKLAELTADVLFGDVWERPELSKRDRSLITVSVLVALYRTGQLPGHFRRALDNGVTKEEIMDLNVAELRAKLSELDEPVQGLKEDVQERLVAAMDEAGLLAEAAEDEEE